jgi:hypothetical protein
MSPRDAYPLPNPPPGTPIWPSSAASAIDIHTGCSPYSARCSDHEVVTMVRAWLILRARSTSVEAGTADRAEAHSGVLATPSRRPVT